MSQNIDDFLSASMAQWAQDYWAALYNPVQTQQTNVGQQLAAGPSVQQPQTQPSQVQLGLQQVASQQQAPASVSQPQAIDQAQSQVPVQKIGTPPADVGIEGQGFDAGNRQITYQGEGHFNPVYDEVGQVVQNNWISDVPTRLSDADTSEIVTTGTGQKISRAALEQQMYGKQVGDWNMNLPAIEQGGLDIDTINVLKQLENNPNSPYGAVFNPEEWDEGPAFYNPGVSEQVEELRRLQAQGGDPTNYAGQMENLRGQEHLSLRNKATGEIVPYYQLFRDFPQQADLINTKIAEYARRKPWWKEDLVPGIIKGISATIAAAAGGGMLGPLFGSAGTAAGLGAGTAGTLGTAAGMGTGAALAQNAMMEGDIGDRLLPTALAFGGGALMPYVSDYVSGLIPQSWKDAVSGWTSGLSGGEEVGVGALTEGGMVGPGGVSGSPEELAGISPTGAQEAVGTNWDFGEPPTPTEEVIPFDQQRPSWAQRGEGKYSLYPQNEEEFLNQLAENRYGRTSWEYDLADSGQRAFDELGNQQYVDDVTRGLTIDPETGRPYLDIINPETGLPLSDAERAALFEEVFPNDPLSQSNLDKWVQDLNNQSWQNRWVENIDARGYDQLGVENQDFVDWLYNNSWNGQPLSALDRYGSGFNWKDYIPSASTLAAISGILKPFLTSTPEVSGTGGGASVHAGGGAESAPDFSELAGLLARSAGGGGGGQTGPQAGSAKGGGFGEGGMLALMNLVLNEMQKGGKYYFQT